MKNEIVRIPNRGDIVALDEKKNIIYIASESFDKSALNRAYTLVGVVVERNGRDLFIVNKDSKTEKWAEVYKWYVTGWQLDGSPHETTISFYDSQAKPSNPTFTYTANSIEEVATQLKAWFDTYFAESKERYNCYMKDSLTLEVVCETYANWYQYTFKMSGLDVAYGTGEGLPLETNSYAYNGTGNVYKGMNWGEFYEYMHDTTSSTFNPKEPIHELGYAPISYKSYSSNIGEYARNIYGEGEEGYKAYLKDYMMVYPSQRGILGLDFRDGHKNTYAMANVMFNSSDGSQKVEYPASHYCAETGYDNPLLAKGRWHLPTLYEQYKLYSRSKTDYSDVVNKSLIAIGGTQLHFAYAWSCCRRVVDFSWIFYGLDGFSSSDYLYNRYWCVPVLLLSMSECE